MNKKVAIRHEDRYLMERRAAITPRQVKLLTEKYDFEFYVESSKKRVFSDEEYKSAGAKIVDDVSDIPVVFGVKEMPLHLFQDSHTYVFFSHTVKGQEYNMPIIKKMIEKKANLIDYEKIRDTKGRRLIFFGRYAGLAGAINSLWAYGQRLLNKGIENPFSVLKQAHKYNSLNEAQLALEQMGMKILKSGLPKEICPMVIGITGYGNVSKGVQEMLSYLPCQQISADKLPDLDMDKLPNNVIYKVVFKEMHLVENIKGKEFFELSDYYAHPEKYRSTFDKYVDKLSLLINAMYWDTRYPRLISNEYLKENYSDKHKLKVIGDITCDPKGSIECTKECTTIEAPVFVFDTKSQKKRSGFDGNGIVVMGVDILPSELPRESSQEFSDILYSYIKEMIECDYTQPFDKLELPPPIKRALILHNGKFTPEFEYMSDFIK